MKVIITFTFCCENLWKSKFVALEKPGKLRIFFSYFVATLFWFILPIFPELLQVGPGSECSVFGNCCLWELLQDVVLYRQDAFLLLNQLQNDPSSVQY